MFNKYINYSHYYNSDKNHEIRNKTIASLFDLLRIFWQITPFLVILKLCNVVNIGWGILIAMYFGYALVDYLSDILQIMLRRHDETKAREEYEKLIKKEEEQK